MIVQIAFRYNINLERILYCEYDKDVEEVRIVFDSGIVLTLTRLEEINALDNFIKLSSISKAANGS